MESLRGKTVLVDFWLPGWTAWERDLPHLADLYETYRPHGFIIIGIPLQPDVPDLHTFLSANRMAWEQVEPTRELTQACGVTGDATSLLVNGTGVIIGRNLRGAELARVVRAAVGQPEGTGAAARP